MKREDKDIILKRGPKKAFAKKLGAKERQKWGQKKLFNKILSFAYLFLSINMTLSDGKGLTKKSSTPQNS